VSYRKVFELVWLMTSHSIIFSSWTRSLDLVELHLDRLGIAYMRVDGNTEASKRQPTFDAFKDDENTRVLLMTTGTGAYGYARVGIEAKNRLN
jgi:SWI/SNF-related matrix-associated actin-dependent regulator of chromatin subfamily A3